MAPYIVTLALGLGVGVIYGLSGVRSPAPPVIALVGLLGILAGEQAVAAIKRYAAGHGISSDWLREHAAPHLFGRLPPQPDPHATPASGKGDRA
jgi:XapX domain-containing protein